MTRNADQITYWNEVAGPVWVTGQARLDRMMAPLTEALIEGAAPRPGESVLDIGCGCGDLSLQVADRVGADGKVDAVDISEPMLAHAARRAEARAAGSGAIDWQRADAMIHPFGPLYDLLISRFGVMFFDDRQQAFANLRKAMKPDGRLAFLTWRGRHEVEWMQKPLDWMDPVLPVPDPTDGEVGPFGLADGEATRELLANAGFWDVQAEPVDRTLTIGDSVDDAFSLLLEAGPASRHLRDAEPGPREKAKALLYEGLVQLARGGKVRMRGACWLYRGRADQV